MARGQETRTRLWLNQSSAVAVAKGSGYDAHAAESGSVRARSCRVSWLWKCSERPAGAKAAVIQGLV